MKGKFLLTRISPSQINIFFVAVTILLFFYVVWLQAYHPARQYEKRLLRQMEIISEQTQLIYQTIPQGENVFNEIYALESVLNKAKKKLPSDEKVVTKILNDLAGFFNLEVTSIQAAFRKSIFDENNRAMYLFDRKIEQVPFKLQLRGNYEDLTMFLEQVYKTSNLYVIVHSMNVRRIEGEPQKLSIILNLNIYLSESDG